MSISPSSANASDRFSAYSYRSSSTSYMSTARASEDISPCVVSDTESDKDLMIHSLNESLNIHKEILEKIHSEKEAHISKLECERQKELYEIEQTKQLLEEQMDRYNKLDAAYHVLLKELDTRKEDYQRMESKFYAHVKTIRATDDDLSTIHQELSHLASQLNNLCMGLKSRMDIDAASTYLYAFYKDQQDLMRQHLNSLPQPVQDEKKEVATSMEPNPPLDSPSSSSSSSSSLSAIQDDKDTDDQPVLSHPIRFEPRHVTMLTEKLVMDHLLAAIFDQPLHIGISVNSAYRDVTEWMSRYNMPWADRLRQQMSSLVANQAIYEEKDVIELATLALIDQLLNHLGHLYPVLQKLDHKDTLNQKKKIEAIVTRAARLSLAMQGQDIKVGHPRIQPGTPFDSQLMKPVGKGKTDGNVLFAITPPFIATDPNDQEHGFTIHAKVFCI
ncbi:hypothetical protein DM01DRAFT_1408307 [Hesseltinella vesiculosa]|uniref:Uncharacterized protein n=1 Tax=Hesseltinella vesiculosa TaxID=101127 RepID=A0A1X2GF96_9FUNG|nr:hypothetical protein DM01DRAFT_1408307 [Hesseltinella vesiculosa]